MEKGFCARDITCRLWLVEGSNGLVVCVGGGGVYSASGMAVPIRSDLLVLTHPGQSTTVVHPPG